MEGSLQVFHEVIGIFETDGEANEAIGDAEFGSIFGTVACMGHGSGLFDQRFDGP